MARLYKMYCFEDEFESAAGDLEMSESEGKSGKIWAHEEEIIETAVE